MEGASSIGNSVITFTGGTGSFGATTARDLFDRGAGQADIFGRHEAKQDDMRGRFNSRCTDRPPSPRLHRREATTRTKERRSGLCNWSTMVKERVTALVRCAVASVNARTGTSLTPTVVLSPVRVHRKTRELWQFRKQAIASDEFAREV